MRSQPIVRWELKRTFVQPRVEADQERLTEILADGWEPFAASPAPPAGDVYYFRRRDVSELIDRLERARAYVSELRTDEEGE